MRFKILYCTFLLLLIVLSVNGQSESQNQKMDSLKNQISLEIFGNGIKYSVNYERILTSWTQINIASRLGFGYYPFRHYTLSMPLEITTFWGNKRDFAETGLGLTFCRQEKSGLMMISPQEGIGEISRLKRNQILFTFRFGYRYQKPNGRSSIRIAFTVIFEASEGILKLSNPQLPVGISYGYRF